MYVRLSVFLVFLIDVLSASQNNELIEEEKCNTEIFEASCPPGQIIIIEYAQYGRQKLGRCIKENFGYLGCVKDVMQETEFTCSGRRSCKFSVDDVKFKKKEFCSNELKNHLWVGYRCLHVYTPTDKCAEGEFTQIKFSSNPVLAPHTPLDENSKTSQNSKSSLASTKDTYHYLSSVVTEETGCGSRSSPWLLKAGEGQRINLTLYDYSNESLEHYYGHKNSSLKMPSKTCRILATVSENASRNEALRICAGQGKIHTVYTSTSNQFLLRMLLPSSAFESPNENNSPQPNALGFQFFFKIQVIGCASPPVQTGMRVRRIGSHAVIDCGSDVGPKWEMTCINDVWVGGYKNCTQSMLSFSSKLEMMFPYATSIVVVAIIASIMVCFILTAGILCIKWRLKQDLSHTHYQTKSFGSSDLVYDFSAVNQHPFPPGDERKYRPLPADASTRFPPGYMENLNEYATMRLLQQEAEGGFRNNSQSNIFSSSAHSAPHSMSTMVVMAPVTSVASMPYPSNVTTFLSSDLNDEYRTDHIYESPDLVKAEVDKRNMVGMGGAYPSSSKQPIPINKGVQFNVNKENPTSPKIVQPKRTDNRTFQNFQPISNLEALRGDFTDDLGKRSNLNRDLKL